MNSFRVALIGLGSMGVNHARVLNSMDQVDLVATYDSNRQLDLNEQGSIMTESISGLLSRKPDYCVIASPTVTHEQLASEILSQGVPVLIEKPLCTSLLSAQRVRDISVSGAIFAGVGHVERFNAALREAKLRINKGQLGQIYQISTRRLGPFPNRVKDVGVVLDLATHDIDLTQWLMNSRYQKVTAHSSFRSGGINEDLVSVVGMLENGVVINHNVNWLSPLKERKVIITGEKGTFVVDTLRSDLTFYENGSFPNTQRELAYFRGVTQGEVTVYAFEKPEALKVEHLEFIKGLSGDQSETVSLDEATETIKVAESILSSTITGEAVTI